MNRAQIVIVDEDADYCRGLDGCLRAHLGFPVTMHDYTDPYSLAEYTLRKETAVLMISERLVSEADLSGFPGVIILTEGTGQGTLFPDPGKAAQGAQDQVIRRVPKYRPLSLLMREVRSLCLDFGVTPGKEFNPGGARQHRIGFFTPLGRCLQSTAALTLAKLYAEKKKTLFLTFDPFPGIDWENCSGEETGDLSELLYYFECDPDRFAVHVEKNILHVGALSVIAPSAVCETISEPPPEKWKAFFGALEEKTDYEVIMADLSICVRGVFDLLNTFDRIITIVRSDPVSAEELKQYERMLRRTGHETLREKTRELELPVFRRLPADPGDYHRGELADHMRTFLTQLEGEALHADT